MLIGHNSENSGINLVDKVNRSETNRINTSFFEKHLVEREKKFKTQQSFKRIQMADINSIARTCEQHHF